MNEFVRKDGTFTLFRNDKKTDPDHADYRGEGMFKGVECWMNAWIKDGKKGKYMSGTLKPKNEATSKTRGYEPRSTKNEDPF
jgi:hypothetical protein